MDRHTLPINLLYSLLVFYSRLFFVFSLLFFFSLSCLVLLSSPFLFFSLLKCEMKMFVHLGGGGTFTARFDKVAAIGVSECVAAAAVGGV